jgi:hypothetical protein
MIAVYGCRIAGYMAAGLQDTAAGLQDMAAGLQHMAAGL